MLSACVITSSRAEPIDVNLNDTPTVTYCELVKYPDRFHGKMIRVSAIYERGFEKSYLYAPDCANGHREMWVGHDKSIVLKGESEEAKRNRMVSGFGRWSVTMVGKFLRATPPERFGHIGCCPYKFDIVRIEKSDELPDKAR